MFKYIKKKNYYLYCILYFKKLLVLIDKIFVNMIGEIYLNMILWKMENFEV